MFGKDLLDQLDETKEKHTTDVDILVAVTVFFLKTDREFSGFSVFLEAILKSLPNCNTHTFTFIKLALQIPDEGGYMSSFIRWAVLKTAKPLKDSHASIMKLDVLGCTYKTALTSLFSAITVVKELFLQSFSLFKKLLIINLLHSFLRKNRFWGKS